MRALREITYHQNFSDFARNLGSWNDIHFFDSIQKCNRYHLLLIKLESHFSIHTFEI
jgi:hypothetical protein